MVTLGTTLSLALFSLNLFGQEYPNKVVLGRALFQDRNLSLDRTVSCASCHQVDHAFADSRSVSTGVDGRRGTRHAPSLLKIGEYRSFFWDGRATTLEQQARLTMFSTVECGFSSGAQVVERVEQNSSYVHALLTLDKSTSRRITISDVTDAIVAYERSLDAPRNALDRYLAGDKAALSLSARRGLEVFSGKADCAACHVISGRNAPLTDNQFHSSSVGLAAIARNLAALAAEVAHMNRTERFQKIGSDDQIAALGRYVVTLNPQDIGKFRTPSLRNVALTGPYMHDGSVATLTQAVDLELYYRGITLGHPILLSPTDKRDLLVFLHSLSSLPKQRQALVFIKFTDSRHAGSRPDLIEHIQAQPGRGP